MIERPEKAVRYSCHRHPIYLRALSLFNIEALRPDEKAKRSRPAPQGDLGEVLGRAEYEVICGGISTNIRTEGQRPPFQFRIYPFKIVWQASHCRLFSGFWRWRGRRLLLFR